MQLKIDNKFLIWNEVDSRYVNLKYIKDSEWIFFSNYNSPKSIAFNAHNQVSAVIYWKSINLQIRILKIKGKIFLNKLLDSFNIIFLNILLINVTFL